MLVCLCHPTSDAEIEAHVETGARSVEDIGRRCGAGTGCGACRCQIEDMLDELAPEEETPSPPLRVAKSSEVDCPQRALSLRSRPSSSKEAA